VILYFFRDPRRIIEYSPNVFYSPGDGTVSDITRVNFPLGSEQPFVRIGIFLSVFNVHVQRAPISGKVLNVTHHPGEHFPAYNPLASLENEQISMEIDSRYGPIIVKQISGILARKCFNYSQKGDHIRAGQRYGLIKFGSRVELFIPISSTVSCKVGDKVFGGLTPLANIDDE
jgi:phosphatidylserine decarboxylase